MAHGRQTLGRGRNELRPVLTRPQRTNRDKIKAAAFGQAFIRAANGRYLRRFGFPTGGGSNFDFIGDFDSRSLDRLFGNLFNFHELFRRVYRACQGDCIWCDIAADINARTNKLGVFAAIDIQAQFFGNGERIFLVVNRIGRWGPTAAGKQP